MCLRTVCVTNVQSAVKYMSCYETIQPERNAMYLIKRSLTVIFPGICNPLFDKRSGSCTPYSHSGLNTNQFVISRAIAIVWPHTIRICKSRRVIKCICIW